MPSQCVWPGCVICADPCIEIAHDYQFFFFRNRSDTLVKLTIEYLFGVVVVRKRGSVNSDDMLEAVFLCRGDLQGHQSLVNSTWEQLETFGNVGFDGHAYTMHASLTSWEATPEEDVLAVGFS